MKKNLLCVGLAATVFSSLVIASCNKQDGEPVVVNPQAAPLIISPRAGVYTNTVQVTVPSATTELLVEYVDKSGAKKTQTVQVSSSQLKTKANSNKDVAFSTLKLALQAEKPTSVTVYDNSQGKKIPLVEKAQVNRFVAKLGTSYDPDLLLTNSPETEDPELLRLIKHLAEYFIRPNDDIRDEVLNLPKFRSYFWVPAGAGGRFGPGWYNDQYFHLEDPWDEFATPEVRPEWIDDLTDLDEALPIDFDPLFTDISCNFAKDPKFNPDWEYDYGGKKRIKEDDKKDYGRNKDKDKKWDKPDDKDSTGKDKDKKHDKPDDKDTTGKDKDKKYDKPDDKDTTGKDKDKKYDKPDDKDTTGKDKDKKYDKPDDKDTTGKDKDKKKDDGKKDDDKKKDTGKKPTPPRKPMPTPTPKPKPTPTPKPQPNPNKGDNGDCGDCEAREKGEGTNHVGLDYGSDSNSDSNSNSNSNSDTGNIIRVVLGGENGVESYVTHSTETHMTNYHSSGVVMFEDSWPNDSQDKDFNDLVIDYDIEARLADEVTMVRCIKNNAVLADKEQIKVVMHLRAVGSDLTKTAGLVLKGIPSDMVEEINYKVTLDSWQNAKGELPEVIKKQIKPRFETSGANPILTIDGLDWLVSEEAGRTQYLERVFNSKLSSAKFPAVENVAKELYNTVPGYMVDPGKGLITVTFFIDLKGRNLLSCSDALHQGEVVKHAITDTKTQDFFMVHATANKNEFLEVHCKGYEPRESFKATYAAKNLYPAANTTYVNNDNVVWAFKAPVLTRHAWEGASFFEAYPNFKAWLDDNEMEKSWYLDMLHDFIVKWW